MPRETIRAVITRVTPQSYGWDICLGPEEDTWVSVYREDHHHQPFVGDVATVIVPVVTKITPMGAMNADKKDR